MVTHHDFGQFYVDRLGFLMRWSAILASSLTKEEVFDRLARAAVPYLADWCSVVIVDSQGDFMRVGIAHIDPEIDGLLRQLPPKAYLPSKGSKFGVAHVIGTGQSQLLREVDVTKVLTSITGSHPDEELRRRVLQAGMSSMMTAPLVAHGKTLGAISMFNRSGRPSFEPSDLELAEELSCRAALSVHTLLRLENVTQDREILEEIMVLYKNFVVSRVVDTRTPLTAARLKAEYLAARMVLRSDRVLLEKGLKDIDRAVEAISSLADELVFENLLGKARALPGRKAG